MDVVRITGGKKLQGKICVQGSKNAALPMMAAALLHKGVSVLRQCPKLTDVFYMEEILRSLGAVTWWEKEDLYLDCTFADKTEIPVYLSQKMRSSIILMGAILSRHKKVMVGYFILRFHQKIHLSLIAHTMESLLISLGLIKSRLLQKLRRIITEQRK